MRTISRGGVVAADVEGAYTSEAADKTTKEYSAY